MYQFISPQKIFHGEGALDNLELIIEELQAKKVFLVADPILEELGIIEKLTERFEKANVHADIFTHVIPEPPLHIGNEVLEAVRKSDPDLVVGIGGGSALDLAKAAAALADHEGEIGDYLNLTGHKKPEKKGRPKVLIPTTAGTGAEVTDIAVFSLEDTKDVISHPNLLADYAIVDPKLTYTLPPRVTASSGIDAFTHALEAYTSVNATPLTDALAMDAMRRIIGSIRTAVWDGQDKKARDEMALGSMIAGMSFYNAGVAGVHALAYPLGGLFKLPHGESNAVLLPYVYDCIWPSCIGKIMKVAELFGVAAEGKSEREIALEWINCLHDLVKDVGLPTKLSDYSIEEKDIGLLAANGIKQKRLLARSPKELDIESIKEIYTNAFNGVLAKG